MKKFFCKIGLHFGAQRPLHGVNRGYVFKWLCCGTEGFASY